MMSFVTQNRAAGSTEATTLATSPKTTTARPASHTNFSTTGTLRRAVSRSRHPLQNSGPSFTMDQMPLRRSGLVILCCLDSEQDRITLHRLRPAPRNDCLMRKRTFRLVHSRTTGTRTNERRPGGFTMPEHGSSRVNQSLFERTEDQCLYRFTRSRAVSESAPKAHPLSLEPWSLPKSAAEPSFQ